MNKPLLDEAESGPNFEFNELDLDSVVNESLLAFLISISNYDTVIIIGSNKIFRSELVSSPLPPTSISLTECLRCGPRNQN